jgi:protein-S-isoprenylcysteine O-methyltransferase Ste14
MIDLFFWRTWIMVTGFYQSLALLAVVVVFYGVDSWLIHRYDKHRVRGSSRSWSYTLFAWAAAAVIVAQPVWLPGLGLSISARWGLALQGLGLAVITASLLLHWWARVTLRHYYGEREEVQPGQQLVVQGPYLYLRHPIYTSYFALAIGMLLIAPALTTVAATVYAFVDFVRAADREEKLLIEQLPGYQEYMRKVGRFFPKLG